MPNGSSQCAGIHGSLIHTAAQPCHASPFLVVLQEQARGRQLSRDNRAVGPRWRASAHSRRLAVHFLKLELPHAEERQHSIELGTESRNVLLSVDLELLALSLQLGVHR